MPWTLSRSTPAARGLALACLAEIESGGYANVVVPAALDKTTLSTPDRHFVTELVYGTTRMRRGCDFLVDAHLERPQDIAPAVRNALRLGAYQLHYLQTPAHAAVSATVDEVPSRDRGLLNAVLRQVALAPRPTWPARAVELSYPDWIAERLGIDLGRDVADEAMAIMNQAAQATERADGYFQDRASQWVAELVGEPSSGHILDACAAPGGKATALAHRCGTGLVVAADYRLDRARVILTNAKRLELGNVAVVVADARTPPWPPACFDRVLVDAPCSGLGVLRRRPDARWRIQPEDVARLSQLQCRLVDQAASLLKPGGMLVYSVCTLTLAETAGVDRWLSINRPELVPVSPPEALWQPWGRGAMLLPQTAGTDGMYLLRLVRPLG